MDQGYMQIFEMLRQSGSNVLIVLTFMFYINRMLARAHATIDKLIETGIVIRLERSSEGSIKKR